MKVDMKWINPKDKLPEKDKDTLCIMRNVHGETYPTIRWRSPYDDSVVDSNGFVIYPTEIEVIAWMDIPDYISLTQ